MAKLKLTLATSNPAGKSAIMDVANGDSLEAAQKRVVVVSRAEFA